LFVSTGIDASNLHMAAFTGDLASVKKFIRQGTEVDAKDSDSWTPLWWAISSRRQEVARFLIESGADVNTTHRDDLKGRSVLLFTVRKGCVKLVELLIARGADVNAASGSRSSTPLNAAALTGNKPMVEILIAKGADVSGKRLSGRTPLYSAAEQGHTEVVKLLIAKGADVNASDRRGRTPLAIAESKGHTEIVEMLLKHGAKE